MAEKKNQVAKEPATDKTNAGNAERYRMRKQYAEEVVPALIKRFGYKNINEVPRLEKIVLNMGLGDCKDNSKSLQLAVEELKMIAGQKPVITTAKKSVANFKVREGMNLGCKVTLRGERMYEFLDKLMNLTLPRVRDFHGVSATGFDGRGNYTLGLKEQLIFPEIEYDKVDKARGMDITIVTTATTDEEGRDMLKMMGMPFEK